MGMPKARAKAAARHNGHSRRDLDVIKADLATLKRDLLTLFTHLEAGAVDGAGGVALKAVGQFGNETMRLYDTVAEEARTRSQQLCTRVKEQPLASVLFAFVLGAFFARAGKRRLRHR